MKIIIYTLSLIVFITVNTSHADSFDYSVINGKWGAYKDNFISDDWFNYLEINEKGGKYIYSYHCEPYVYNFTKSNIKQTNGVLLIELSKDNASAMRLIVSAFRTDLGSSLLTGSLYMFKIENGVETLFNTIPQRMTDLNRDTALKEKLQHAISKNSTNC